MLLDVPDSFFTLTFPMLGLLLGAAKGFARAGLEERAWEQRLADGRRMASSSSTSVTELDVRRAVAAQAWSAYGNGGSDSPSPSAAAANPRREQQQQQQEKTYRGRGRRLVLDRDDDYEYDDDTMGPQSSRQAAAAADSDHENNSRRRYGLSDAEIDAFALEHGVAYDPYYDDPYTVDDLPDGRYVTDRLYGDRVYANGEIFYRDNTTGSGGGGDHTTLYYRQGSKPRNFTFFG